MPDRWQSAAIICSGGLDLSTDSLTQGTNFPGSARILQNYEPSISGGYRRVSGFSKYDSNQITGSGAILGVGVAINGVIAVRYDDVSSYDVYYSTGSGWTEINSASRTSATTKARVLSYNLSGNKAVIVDGANYALKYDGSSDTLINGTGAPTAPKYAAFWKERLVLAPASTTSSIAIAAPNTDTDFNGANGAIEINFGDTIRGLKSFRGTLYVFCENSIYRVLGNTSADFISDRVTGSIGCISQDSIQEVGGDLIFLAPDGLRSIAATDKIGDVNLGLLSEKIHPILRDLVELDETKYSSCPIRKKSQYRIFFNQGLSTDASFGILGKLGSTQTGLGYEWATTVGFPSYCADSAYVGDSELAVFGCVSTGYVYQMESGNDFDGANVASIFKTPDITLGDSFIRKVMFKIKLYTEIEGSVSSTLQLIYDRDQNVNLPPSISISGDGGQYRYGNPASTYGTATYSGSAEVIFNENLIGSGDVVAFKFSDTSTNAPLRIDSFEITYAIKGRR